MSEEEVERRSLEDLQAVLKEALKQGIKLVIIGGYAGDCVHSWLSLHERHRSGC